MHPLEGRVRARLGPEAQLFPRETCSGIEDQLPILGLRFLRPPATWSPFAFSEQASKRRRESGLGGGLTPQPLLSHLMVSCSAQPSPGGVFGGWGPPSRSATGRRRPPPAHLVVPITCAPHTVSGVGGWGSGRRHPFLSPQSVCVPRAALASAHQCHPLPRTLSVLKSTPQVRGMHTIIR